MRTVLCMFVIPAILMIPGNEGVFGAEWVGKCTGAKQGDTITVLKNGQPVEVRIWGIDAPDSGQEYNLMATAITAELVSGQDVTIEEVVAEQRGKIVGRVKLHGKDVAVTLVAVGAAMYDGRYIQNEELETAENRARTEKRGLWSYSNPLPAWQFREKMKNVTVPDLLSQRDGHYGSRQALILGLGEDEKRGDDINEEDDATESKVNVVERGARGLSVTPERLSIDTYYKNGSSVNVFVTVPQRCRRAGSFQFEVNYLLMGGERSTTGAGSWAAGELSGRGRASLDEEAEIINVRILGSTCH